jgi:hypothetical protein
MQRYRQRQHELKQAVPGECEEVYKTKQAKSKAINRFVFSAILILKCK